MNIPESNWPDILRIIQQNTGLTPGSGPITSAAGGCINSSYLLGQGERQIFIKINRLERLCMFEAEAAGLKTIASTGTICVPTVYCTGQSGDTAFIAMQAIIMRGSISTSYREFGVQLAALHRYQKSSFGATIDNTIGSTPQHNSWSNDWYGFWRKHRLEFQLELARNNDAPTALIDDGLRLSESFEVLFDKPPSAACLHGDLWQGNWGFTTSGKVVIFDPAHYFGDRETDIAMTTLFGRAHPDFYAAYEEAYPLSSGYAVREIFYNIYHILNHFNLFGGAYASQAHHMIRNVLSELR
jgi:protein-ribulosamine 3-kinase